jgi:predicted PurR-regulated permease PerM
MTKPARISYWVVIGMFFLVGWLHLGTPLLAALFSFFILEKFHWIKGKWLAVSVFAVVVLGIAYGTGHFIKQAAGALPAVAERAIPSIIGYAEKNNVELPFTDWQSLKESALNAVKEQRENLDTFARFANNAARQLVFLVIGIVVAVSIFLNNKLDLDHGTHAIRDNLYSMACEELRARFRSLYHSFATVMGAQLIISTINTALTSIFVLCVTLPHGPVVIGVTFLCGMLPVIGNLLSNAIIVAIAFTVSPQMALVALAFLVVIHKLEYFLNSKIIGDRIRNPIWITLLGLILGEKLMGVPGMILAPVILNYIKVEASKIEVAAADSALAVVSVTDRPDAPDKNVAAG